MNKIVIDKELLDKLGEEYRKMQEMTFDQFVNKYIREQEAKIKEPVCV